MSDPELDEPAVTKALFERLATSSPKDFTRGVLGAPDEHGVYVIYSAVGKPLYVGRTDRISRIAKNARGLRRRLSKHRAKYGSKHCFFQFLIVEDLRQRALLEAYATGCLCPADFYVADKNAGSDFIADETA